MLKPDLGFVLLFVKNPSISAIFYEKMLGLKPIQQSSTFVLFALTNGVMLGIWSYQTAQPAVNVQPGASEIAFGHHNVDSLHEEWKTKQVTIAQEPTDMSFGRTFVALDPDGHRIRIYAIKEGTHA